MPPTFSFLLLLADLRCLLRLCLCPELSLLHCLMIDLQYSCLHIPLVNFHSDGNSDAFTINPGGDLLPLNRRRCSHGEKNVSLPHCAENIYMMKLALKLCSSSLQMFFIVWTTYSTPSGCMTRLRNKWAGNKDSERDRGERWCNCFWDSAFFTFLLLWEQQINLLSLSIGSFAPWKDAPTVGKSRAFSVCARARFSITFAQECPDWADDYCSNRNCWTNEFVVRNRAVSIKSKTFPDKLTFLRPRRRDLWTPFHHCLKIQIITPLTSHVQALTENL